MSIAIVTGSAGLIGASAASFLAKQGMDVVGIDNDMRKYFYGNEASTRWNKELLERSLKNYDHVESDIRNQNEVEALFQRHGKRIALVLHAAGQPSHDWAAREPHTDFSINAAGRLNLLEATRRYSPEAVFIFTSTNKIYGDTPNQLPLVELETRWELPPTHHYAGGIDETMSIDQSLHSLFGVSKLSADLLVQEYGDISGCVLLVSVVAALPVPPTREQSSMAFWPIWSNVPSRNCPTLWSATKASKFAIISMPAISLPLFGNFFSIRAAVRFTT